MIGGMDQINILEAGSRLEIELEVDRLFHLFGRQGGYIMSACDHFFEVPPQNLKYFAEAAKNYCYSLG
jgi:uroporphyrinogen-III decarboxylase